MARQKMVTRTFKTMSISVLVVNKENAELRNVMIELPREITDATKLFKACVKAISDPNLVVVEVSDFTVNEKLMGIPEADFIKYAVEIPRK